MNTENNELKNGLELTITAQLFLELCGQYPVKKLLKKRLNDFLLEAEKDIEKEYNKVYKTSPEFCTNSIRMRDKFIKNIAQLNEADFMLLENFVDKFIDNLPIARQKGILFFEKLNQ